MTKPQWMTTLSLALEIPFDSNEEKLWSKLFEEFTKFGDIFITTLSTIDIVRLPFIDYSLVKFYNNYDTNTKSKQENVFKSLQGAFQIYMRQRAMSEILDLQETDVKQFKMNLNKLHDKINELSLKHPKDENMKNIVIFIDNLNQEIKDLEENGSNDQQEEI